MRSFVADLRHGVRLLWRSPLFTIVASLSLALGIGANTAIFTVLNTLVLEPLPVREPARLVSIFTSDFSGPPHGASSYPDAVDFAAGTPALEGVAASRIEALSMTSGRATERVYAEIVSPSYFDLLGVRTVLGRPFHAAELASGGVAAADAPHGVILGHRFWSRQFGADPAIVGRQIVLNGQAFSVAGVLDASYAGLMRVIAVDVWVPVTEVPRLLPRSQMRESRTSRGWMLVGRLAPGATLDQARAQLDVQAARLHAAHPREWTDVNQRGRRVTVLPESEARLPPEASGAVIGFLAALLALVGIVLLVACANVAGLLVARGTARKREIAVRLALGSGRLRLVRQLLTESAALAAFSGAIGLLVATWTLALLARLEPPTPFPLALEMTIDGRVLLFTTITALASGIIFGLAPAIHATRVALLPVLRNDITALNVSRRLTLRNLLVVGQVALSLLLLVVGGLFLRSVQRAYGVDTGFDTRNVMTATIDPSMLGYQPARTAQTHADVLARARAMPGVQSAAFARVVPLTFGTGRRGMRPEGYQARVGEDLEEPYNIVTSGYFATMGMRLTRGRDFTDADRPDSEPVIIVNQAFAERYWPGQDPLQRRVGVGDAAGRTARVIAVVANAKYFSLAEQPRATMFLPFLQHPVAEATLHVKTRGQAEGLGAALRSVIQSVDPALPVLDLVALEERTSLAVLPQRIAVRLLGAFGSLALLMAAMGLYGLLAQSVAQRTKEIGIRLALGAARGDVVRLVVGQGLALTAVGVGLGLAIAIGTTHLLRAFLVGVSPLDPIAYLTALGVLASAALLAVWLPARRATVVDPAVTLRYE